MLILLKFCDCVPWCGFSVIQRTGYLVGPFNHAVHVFPFRETSCVFLLFHLFSPSELLVFNVGLPELIIYIFFLYLSFSIALFFFGC